MPSTTRPSSIAACLGALVLVLASANATSSFDAWRAAFGVTYTSAAEAARREAVFTANLRTIEAHNAHGPRGYDMGLNQFSDLTFDEWVARVSNKQSNHMLRQLRDDAPRRGNTAGGTTDLPSSVDWLAKGVLGPVRNDGTCSAAWSFTVTDTITAMQAIQTSADPVALSPQQLIDCTAQRPWGLDGCHGGWPQIAYTYVTTRGLCSAESYPFHASQSTCMTNCTTVVPPYQVSYAALPPSEPAFMQQVVQQPVMAAIGLVPQLQHYKSGVFTAPCNTTFEHCVTIAGYGTSTAGQDYWLIRNNFGATWGNHGYLWLGRGMTYPGGLVHGQCDILGLGLYPVNLTAQAAQHQVAPAAPAVPATSQAPAASSKRRVRWYLNAGLTDKNVEFATKYADAITGVYPCCGLLQVEGDGSVSTKFSLPQQQAMFQPLSALGLEVWPVIGLNESAVLDGKVSGGIAGIVAYAKAANVTGIMIDYEPASDYTLQHAQKYAAFAKALATALHAEGVELGMDLAQWGILGFYDVYKTVGADCYMSMATYSGKNVTRDQGVVQDMVASGMPMHTLAFGVSSATPASAEKQCHTNWEWNASNLPAFVKWMAEQGVQEVDVWRCDIDDYQGVAEYYIQTLSQFLSGSL